MGKTLPSKELMVVQTSRERYGVAEERFTFLETKQSCGISRDIYYVLNECISVLDFNIF